VKSPVRLFQLFLLLFPRAFRDRFGASMRETFEDRLEESRKEGTRAVAEFGLRTAGDLAREGIRERLRPTLIEARTSGLRNNWMGWGMMMGGRYARRGGPPRVQGGEGGSDQGAAGRVTPESQRSSTSRGTLPEGGRQRTPAHPFTESKSFAES